MKPRNKAFVLLVLLTTTVFLRSCGEDSPLTLSVGFPFPFLDILDGPVTLALSSNFILVLLVNGVFIAWCVRTIRQIDFDVEQPRARRLGWALLANIILHDLLNISAMSFFGFQYLVSIWQYYIAIPVLFIGEEILGVSPEGSLNAASRIYFVAITLLTFVILTVFFTEPRSSRSLPARAPAEAAGSKGLGSQLLPAAEEFQAPVSHEKVASATLPKKRSHRWPWFVAVSIILLLVGLGFSRYLSGGPSAVLKGHTGELSDLAFSPDGELLASVSYQDGTVRLWDLKNGQELAVLQSGQRPVVATWRPAQVAFAPDGRTLAGSGKGGLIRLWDTDTRRSLFTLKTGGELSDLAFSPDGRLLAAGDTGEFSMDDSSTWDDNTTWLWDLETREPLFVSDKFKQDFEFVLSPNGERLAILAKPGIALLSLDSFEIVTRFAGAGNLNAIALSPDGRLLASIATSASRIVVWDTTSKKIVNRLDADDDLILSDVRFAADGRTLITGDCNNSIRRWDLDTGQQTGVLFQLRPQDQCLTLRISPDGWKLATYYEENIYLWSLPENLR